ncbi:MAG TPA: hypothetical protein VNV41_10105 [Candidatus Acidoferrales bacterium]|nr:hypothetical protein [Candidatus Acidoferrales bacterium]
MTCVDQFPGRLLANRKLTDRVLTTNSSSVHQLGNPAVNGGRLDGAGHVALHVTPRLSISIATARVNPSNAVLVVT